MSCFLHTYSGSLHVSELLLGDSQNTPMNILSKGVLCIITNIILQCQIWISGMPTLCTSKTNRLFKNYKSRRDLTEELKLIYTKKVYYSIEEPIAL